MAVREKKGRYIIDYYPNGARGRRSVFTLPINNLHRAVARAKNRAGITKRVYPHLLRHSIATYLVDSDIDIRQIQSFLGHSQITTTEWYTQVSLEKKRQILEKAGFKTSKI
jgi:site-specific recombinase XerD